MTSLAVGRAFSAIPRRAVGLRRGFSALVRVDEEYPGIPATSPQPAKASKPSVSTLPNGVTVVTEDAASSTTVSLTFPKAGSASEMLSEQGAALVNKCLAFQSGSGLSSLVIARNIEDDGGTPFVEADRFGATLGFSCPPEKAARLVPLLATDCSFEKWDVRDARKLAATEVQLAGSSAQVVMTEQIFAAAFGAQSAAGRPFFYSSPATVPLADIKAFRGRGYGLNGAILAATGVSDHEAFVKAVQEGLKDYPAGSSASPADVSFIGGEARLAVATGKYAHVALSFDGSKASSALLNVVKQVFVLSGKAAGVSGFSTKGLVGVYLGGVEGGALADSLCAAVTVKPNADIVKRAKAMAKAEALFALEGSKSLTKVMAASIMESGTFAGAAGIAAAFDKITDKDVEGAVAAMLKKPSLAAVGDITSVPYLGTFASRLG